MPTGKLTLARCAEAFAHAALPVWVVDRNIEFAWANELAIALWRAPDFEELKARRMKASTPPRMLTRFEHIFDRVEQGEVLREDYVFYPKGDPVTVVLDLRRVELPDGRIGMLNQALPSDVHGSDSARRTLAVARYAGSVRVFADASGAVLTMSESAREAFGGLRSWPSCVVEEDVGAQVLERALGGEHVRRSVEVRTQAGVRWQLLAAERLRDPVSGELGVLIEHSDDTARVEAEARVSSQAREIDELQAALALVERQREEILRLLAPMLDVGEQTLAVPLIGRLSADKSAIVTSRLLEAVSGRGIRHVIVDLTGAESLDGEGIAQLLSMVRALRLLGAAATLTGIRPRLAQELVELGDDLAGLATSRTLAEALRRFD